MDNQLIFLHVPWKRQIRPSFFLKDEHAPLSLKGGWGDFMNGVENPPPSPFSKGEVMLSLDQRSLS